MSSLYYRYVIIMIYNNNNYYYDYYYFRSDRITNYGLQFICGMDYLNDLNIVLNDIYDDINLYDCIIEFLVSIEFFTISGEFSFNSLYGIKGFNIVNYIRDEMEDCFCSYCFSEYDIEEEI